MPTAPRWPRHHDFCCAPTSPGSADEFISPTRVHARPSSLPWAELTQTAGPIRSQQFRAHGRKPSQRASHTSSWL